jgi:hypothetical protein
VAIGSDDKCGSITITTVYSDWNCSCGRRRANGTDCIFYTVRHNQHSRFAYTVYSQPALAAPGVSSLLSQPSQASATGASFFTDIAPATIVRSAE